jgi:CO dehydrogenase nickel-insertion accessory protein CooC1
VKIAFVGKGGAGKTTLASLLASYLAAEGRPVLAIDADINQHLAEALGTSPDEAAGLPALGDHLNEIKEYLRGTNPRITSAAAMVKTTPPGRGSRLLRVVEDNPIYQRLGRHVGGVRLLVTGPFTADDLGVACYHSKVGAVELLLNHLVDGPDDYVVVDMTAGADAFASGLFTRFDQTFIVCEPSRRSVAVYRQYADYARDFDVRLSGSRSPRSSPATWRRCASYGGPSTRSRRTGRPTPATPSPSTCATPAPGRTPASGRTWPPRSTRTSPSAPTRFSPAGEDHDRPVTRRKLMSLDVPTALTDRVERGQIDDSTLDAAFLDCVRSSLPYAWQTISRLAEELGPVAGGPGRVEFADNQIPPPDEQARGQLLRALASDAIRTSLERHFGIRLAFQNCHRVAAFRPSAVGSPAYRNFVSARGQILNQTPEFRDC